jgi:hypothetical protein
MPSGLEEDPMDDVIVDFVQQRMIHGARSDASEARRDAGEARSSLSELEERVGRLTLACTAMWVLLRQRTGLTDRELLEVIEEVDLRDGVRDGQHTPSALTCSSCGRRNSRRHRKCMYCESPLAQEPLP